MNEYQKAARDGIAAAIQRASDGLDQGRSPEFTATSLIRDLGSAMSYVYSPSDGLWEMAKRLDDGFDARRHEDMDRQQRALAAACRRIAT